MIKLIIKDWKKVFATLIVSAFFIFFWIHGPLQFTEILAHLEHEATEFSNPKIVGQNHDSRSFGEIEDVETRGEGWELILENSKKNKDQYKVLSSTKNDQLVSNNYLEKLEEHVHLILKGEISTEIRSSGDLHYMHIRKKDRNYFYVESGITYDHIRGYAGPINIGLLVNEYGNIEKVQHVSSKETESYLKKIARTNFYESFIGTPLEDEHTIDAVSGATLTTEAIAQITSALVADSVNNFSDYFSVDLITASFQIIAKNELWWILHITVIGVLFFYGMQKKYKKTKKDIMILSFVSAFYIGFFMNNSFTYVSFLHPFLGTTVSPLIAFYALFSILGAIWGKNAYCKYVCPFGHAQRIGLQLSRKKFSSKFFIKNKRVERIRNCVTVVLVTGILLGLRSWANFEIFPDLFGLEFTSTWFIISLSLILINIKYPFIWCRIACPTGAVLDSITKVTK